MIGKTKLLLALRKPNGTIGFLSEGVEISDLATILKPQKETIVLVDFHPSIEKIHSLYKRHSDEKLHIEYNTMFNYWQDSRTYNDRQIKISKTEHLSQSANKLINTLQIRLNEKSLNLNREREHRKQIQIAHSIEADCEIYSNALLCFIHSKASLEISSFRSEKTLSSYASFLYDLILNIYLSLISYNEEYQQLNTNSILYSLALDKNPETNSFISVYPHLYKLGDLRLIYLDSKNISTEWIANYGNEKTMRWREIRDEELTLAKIFRDLLYKISQITDLLNQLKDGDVEWDSKSESTSELTALIEAMCD